MNIVGENLKIIETYEDLRKIEDYLWNHDNHSACLAFMLIVNTGLGLQDARKLTVSSILNKDNIVIKGNKIPISNRIKERIKEYVQLKELLPSDYLVVNKKGSRLTTQYLSVIFKSAFNKLNMGVSHEHTALKKTFAVHSYLITKDLKIVKRLLNYQSTNTVKQYLGDYYFNNEQIVINEDLKEALGNFIMEPRKVYVQAYKGNKDGCKQYEDEIKALRETVDKMKKQIYILQRRNKEGQAIFEAVKYYLDSGYERHRDFATLLMQKAKDSAS